MRCHDTGQSHYYSFTLGCGSRSEGPLQGVTIRETTEQHDINYNMGKVIHGDVGATHKQIGCVELSSFFPLLASCVCVCVCVCGSLFWSWQRSQSEASLAACEGPCLATALLRPFNERNKHTQARIPDHGTCWTAGNKFGSRLALSQPNAGKSCFHCAIYSLMFCQLRSPNSAHPMPGIHLGGRPLIPRKEISSRGTPWPPLRPKQVCSKLLGRV